MAGIQDRDAADWLPAALRAGLSTIGLVWADGDYAGRLAVWARTVEAFTVQIVKRTDDLAGFRVLPRRARSGADGRQGQSEGAEAAGDHSNGGL